MKAVFALVLGVLSAGLNAMDPPYPTAPVDGYFLRGLDEAYKLSFEPGTLENCKDYPQPSYTSYNCEIKGAELTVDSGTKKHKFVFRILSAQERAGGASVPAIMSYHFNGTYGTTLPDGSTYEADASFDFSRILSDPDKLKGQLNVYSLGVNAGIMMTWPGGSSSSPTPTPAP